MRKGAINLFWGLIYVKIFKKKTEPGFFDGKYYTEYVEEVKSLKKQGKLKEAEKLLLKLLEVIEEESNKKNIGVAPWYYEQLAIIYAKQKEQKKEIAVLERFSKQKHAPGVKPKKLLERLKKKK